MWRDRAKNPRTFPAQTMDTTSETGIIVSGDRHRSVIRDKPTLVGRRLPYLNYPPRSENWPLLCSGPVAHPRGVRRGFLFGTRVTSAFDAYFTGLSAYLNAKRSKRAIGLVIARQRGRIELWKNFRSH